uniref:beta-glucosidase n=1 Tax=Globisporangium ultimum (strain ATCC 200006 / CBS 805.95 / DAOM BR144) TaxID=431595 RepID=K3W7L6_GLOUD
MLRSWFTPVWCCALVACKAFGGVAAADAWDAKADAIVSQFTVNDIIGQMTQVSLRTVLNADFSLNEDKVRDFAKSRVGSYLSSPFTSGSLNGKYGWTAQEWRPIIKRVQEITMEENGGHPIVFGIDSVHGSVFVENSALFGQQINGGASFNPDLVYEMGRVTGRDTEAAGIPWVFGPILEISQNPLWARTFETFGEDPYLVSVMADSVIRGLQSNNATAACMKHFVGYSKTPTGHDRDGVTLSDFDLLNYFVPPFIAAINAGVMSTMENYISINGVPVVSSPKILRDLIRSDMGFEGVAVTDYAEINNLQDWHRCSSGYCQMEWDFGARLSYTTFMYSSVKLSKTTVTGKSDSITASVTVTNSGKMAGKETVMLFVIQPYRSISVPEVKQLKKFKKISLDAGASTTVEFTLTAADWSVYDPQIGNGFVQVAEDGDFVVAVKPETECNVYGAITNPLCAKFELKTGVEPFNLEESLKTRY